MKAGAGNQRGFAIFVVLALAAVLALIASSFTSDSRSFAVGAHNEEVNAKLRAMASGGIDLGIKSILNRPANAAQRLGPQTLTTKSADGRLRILIQDEAGKVDLNTATPELLAALFVFGGAQDKDAQELADRVVDFRSSKRVAASTQPHEDENLPYGYPKGPFMSVTELLQIPGISEQMFVNIRRYATVHSGLSGIDPDVAAPELLAALPPMTAEAKNRLDAARARLRQGAVLSGLDNSDPYFSISSHNVFTITCAADLGGKAVYIQNATIALRNGDKPYDVLEWWTGGRINLPTMTASREGYGRQALA